MQAVMPTAFMARERQSLAFEPVEEEAILERSDPVLAQAGQG